MLLSGGDAYDDLSAIESELTGMFDSVAQRGS